MKLTLKPWRSPLVVGKKGKLKFPPKSKTTWFDKPMRLAHSITEGQYQPIKLQQFNPGSRTQIVSRLKDRYGWSPIIFTKTGSPKIDEETLINLEYPETDLLKEYLKLSKDIGQLGGTDNSMIAHYNPETCSIHHRCDSLGTNTGRMSHSSPNISQTPSTQEFRELYCSPEGYSVVGADLDGQELRILAHYIYPYDGGIYAEAILNGDKSKGTDIHSMNQRMFGLDTRDEAKTAIYALLYGSSYTRIGYSLIGDRVIEYTPQEFKAMKETVEKRVVIMHDTRLFPIAKDMFVPVNDRLIEAAIFGKRVVDSYMEKTVGYKELKAAVIKEAEDTGYITALDGRKLRVRSSHSALNLLFQGAAAIITKYWMRDTHQRLRGYNLIPGRMQDYWPNAVIHDEQNFTVRDKLASLIGETLEASASCIDQFLPLSVPMAATHSIGKTWYDVH